jgi:hypothetical protein
MISTSNKLNEINIDFSRIHIDGNELKYCYNCDRPAQQSTAVKCMDCLCVIYCGQDCQTACSYVHKPYCKELFLNKQPTLFIEELSSQNCLFDEQYLLNILHALYQPEDEWEIHKEINTVSKDGLKLACLSQSFKNNYSIVLAAVTQNGLALRHASLELQSNEYL